MYGESDKIASLIEQIVNHDQMAFKRLYMLYYTRLFQFALHILGSAEVSEEVVSDVFLKVWKNRARLHEVIKMEPYLYIMVRNEAIDRFAEVKRSSCVEIAKVSMLPAPESETPEQRVIRTEQGVQIAIAINTLPPQCRLIFKLAKEDGMKYKEIANLLNISVRTIDAQMAIAIKKLTAILRVCDICDSN